ncbi:MAG: type II toxin-antitoxin system HicB family antitoxin [Dehalococcoidia bacterium]
MPASGQHSEDCRAERRPAGFVVLTFEFHKEGHLWVGRCIELGTATDGRSLEEVEDELAELVSLHLEALEDVGERDRFFQTHGITLYASDPPKEVERRVPVSDRQKLLDFRAIEVRTPNVSRDRDLAEV